MQRFSGQQVKAARIAAGKTREQVAVDIGRGYETVVSYELDRTTPPATVLPRLAHSIGVPIADLFIDIDGDG